MLLPRPSRKAGFASGDASVLFPGDYTVGGGREGGREGGWVGGFREKLALPEETRVWREGGREGGREEGREDALLYFKPKEMRLCYFPEIPL